MLNVPLVDVLVSERMNCDEVRLSSRSALVAVPLNTAPATVVLMFKPGPMVENPDKAAAGVNVASLEKIETMVLLTNTLTTT